MSVTKGAQISAWKCTKSVWRPGSARIRWVSLQRSQAPLAGFKGWGRDKRRGKDRRDGKQLRKGTEEGEGRQGEGRKGREGKKKEKGGRNLAPRSFLKVGVYELTISETKCWTLSLVLWTFPLCYTILNINGTFLVSPPSYALINSLGDRIELTINYWLDSLSSDKVIIPFFCIQNSLMYRFKAIHRSNGVCCRR